MTPVEIDQRVADDDGAAVCGAEHGPLSPKTESLSGVTAMVLAARTGSVLNTEG